MLAWLARHLVHLGFAYLGLAEDWPLGPPDKTCKLAERLVHVMTTLPPSHPRNPLSFTTLSHHPPDGMLWRGHTMSRLTLLYPRDGWVAASNVSF